MAAKRRGQPHAHAGARTNRWRTSRLRGHPRRSRLGMAGEERVVADSVAE